jgi:hypothetical protein
MFYYLDQNDKAEPLIIRVLEIREKPSGPTISLAKILKDLTRRYRATRGLIRRLLKSHEM